MTETDKIWFYDFHYFWAAARAFVTGQNPYDPATFESIVRSTNWPADEGVQTFTHLPSSLPLYAPFGFFSYQTSLMLWLGLIVLSLLGCFTLIKSLLPKTESTTTAKLFLYFLLFPAAYSTILNAQINFVLLLGVLILVKNWSSNRKLAMIGLCLTLLKPHIFIPLYLWIGVKSLQEKRAKELLTPISYFLCLTFAAELILPGIVSAYMLYAQETFSTHQSLYGASLAQVSARFLGFKQSWVLLLGVSSLVSLSCALKRKQPNNRDFDIILSLSIIGAPYLWSHTLLVLALQYFRILLSVLDRSSIFGLCLVTILALTGLFELANPSQNSWALSLLPLLLVFTSSYTNNESSKGDLSKT